jgi:hypothetical protein
VATTITTVFNLAISHAGSRAEVADYAETSREAALCRQHYDTVRQVLLSAASWDGAKAAASLAVLSERDTAADWVLTDPQPGSLFAYGVPNNILRPRNLSTYAWFEYGIYQPGTIAQKRAIFANEATPILVYTFDQTDPQFWDAPLLNAIAYSLAAVICGPLMGSTSKQNQLLTYATEIVLQTRALNANSGNGRALDFVPDWIAARGYSGGAPATPYIYPPADFGSSSFNLVK